MKSLGLIGRLRFLLLVFVILSSVLSCFPTAFAQFNNYKQSAPDIATIDFCMEAIRQLFEEEEISIEDNERYLTCFKLASKIQKLDENNIEPEFGPLEDVIFQRMEFNRKFSSFSENGNIDELKNLFKNYEISTEGKKRSIQDVLYTALEAGHFEIVKFSLKHGAIMTKNDASIALPYAVENDSLELVKLLIKRGAKPNTDMGIPVALTRAAENGNVGIVRYLIKHGAQVNYNDALGGQTALLNAAYMGNLEVVKLLIDSGADITQYDDLDRTLLMMAVRSENIDLVKFVINQGVDIDATDDFHRTALMWAICDDLMFGLETLIESSADWFEKKRSRDRMTREGSVEIVKFLVEKGADFSVVNKNGDTALKLAFKYNREEIIRALRMHGIKD